ncbi:hypothetical protein EV702DRAFT_1050637 [Suillus placidus]|uniref:Uncharacterized protein n=1 Tax=Suillus placidus TaxID=48579 RepID=A0A9P6ZIL9_9AGAM|nr:hypothetical protein EV702DRAFT_1050637 [Suillus placidus]
MCPLDFGKHVQQQLLVRGKVGHHEQEKRKDLRKLSFDRAETNTDFEGCIKRSQEAANSGLLDKEKYDIPPHLHDLQEADLPETQCGLVISEIVRFRERAAKREREKLCDVRDAMPQLAHTPSGPKGVPGKSAPRGKDAQGYNKPVGFVKAEDGTAAMGSDDRSIPGKSRKTDEELEKDRKEARRRDEEVSFRDISYSSYFVRCRIIILTFTFLAILW